MPPGSHWGSRGARLVLLSRLRRRTGDGDTMLSGTSSADIALPRCRRRAAVAVADRRPWITWISASDPYGPALLQCRRPETFQGE